MLGQSKSIVELKVGHGKIGDDGARALLENQVLESLDICSNGVNSEGFEPVTWNTSLKSLRASYNRIGDEGAGYLGCNKGIEFHNLYANGISDEGISELAEKSGLKMLELGSNHIEDRGAMILAALHIETLGLPNNYIGDKGARAFSRSRGIVNLSLELNPIGRDVIRELRETSSANIRF